MSVANNCGFLLQKMNNHSLPRVGIELIAVVCIRDFFFQQITRSHVVFSTTRNISKKKTNQISFALYPAHSRVGSENLVLRHSVPHSPPSSEGIACWVAELKTVLCLDTRAKKWKYKYFISSSGDRTHNQLILQSNFVPLRHDRPLFSKTG